MGALVFFANRQVSKYLLVFTVLQLQILGACVSAEALIQINFSDAVFSEKCLSYEDHDKDSGQPFTVESLWYPEYEWLISKGLVQ